MDDDVMWCLRCDSTDLEFDTGDQEPVILITVHSDGTQEEVKAFAWFDVRCRSCGFRWRDGLDELPPALQMQAARDPMLFTMEEAERLLGDRQAMTEKVSTSGAL
jgi:hypothetical protein